MATQNRHIEVLRFLKTLSGNTAHIPSYETSGSGHAASAPSNVDPSPQASAPPKLTEVNTLPIQDIGEGSAPPAYSLIDPAGADKNKAASKIVKPYEEF